jgi:hypothetical protein
MRKRRIREHGKLTRRRIKGEYGDKNKKDENEEGKYRNEK